MIRRLYASENNNGLDYIIVEKMNRVKKRLSGVVFIGIALMLMANSGGSPGGKAGSPGDKKVSCATNGGCHGPKTPNSQELISTTIPASGYMPGSEYTITISAILSGKSRFGFELVAEDSTGEAKGSFVGNSEVNASGNRATHRFQGTNGSGQKTWNIVWKAPAIPSGDLTFYAAVLAANDNGTTSGDEVILDNEVVKQSSTASISDFLDRQISIYPNPVSEVLNISGGLSNSTKLSILSLKGDVLYSSDFSPKVNISYLPSGSYILKLEKESVVLRKAFIKR